MLVTLRSEAYPIAHRALPQIELLTAAAAQQKDVMRES
jgi:hypothetical protein